MRSKADTHVHTHYSGYTNYKILRFPESVTLPEKQVDNAHKNGMSVLCLTDHDAIKGAFEGREYCKKTYKDMDVVVGEEITSKDGEILGYWLNEFVPPGLSAEETIDIIHGQGGIAVAPHPFSFYVPCLKRKIHELKLDGIEILNGGHVDEFTNTTALKAFTENRGKWAAFSGSDAHSVYTTNYNWTEFEGVGENDFRKAIEKKETYAIGIPAPVFTQVQWSMEVVLGGQKLLTKGLCGKLQKDPDNPLIAKINRMSDLKKFAGIIGGALYLLPPIPFLAAYLSTTWLDSKAHNLMDQMDDFMAAKENSKMRTD